MKFIPKWPWILNGQLLFFLQLHATGIYKGDHKNDQARNKVISKAHFGPEMHRREFPVKDGTYYTIVNNPNQLAGQIYERKKPEIPGYFRMKGRGITDGVQGAQQQSEYGKADKKIEDPDKKEVVAGGRVGIGPEQITADLLIATRMLLIDDFFICYR